MSNKILLAIIALGLWANAFATMSNPARADSDHYLSDISRDIHGIWNGSCLNHKLC
jgi:hypothetical protein